METCRISAERGAFSLTADNTAATIFLGEIPVQKMNFQVTVISNGAFATPTVSIQARSVGDPSALIEELKRIIRLPPSSEIYTSTLFSMKILFWMGRSNVIYFESDLNDLIQTHSPDMFVIVDALMPFGGAIQNFRSFGYTGSIINEAIGENRAIWVVWKETTLNVLQTRKDYSNIHVLVSRNNYPDWAFNAVYRSYENITNDVSIRLPYCPIAIPITENMRMKIYGVCDEDFEGVVGAVILNCKGEWVRGICSAIEVTSLFHAELLALEVSLSYLEKVKWNNITIETNSMEVMKCFNEEQQNMVHCCDLLRECKTLGGKVNATVIHVSSSKVDAAIAMSKFAFKAYPNLNIIDECPSVVQAILQRRATSASNFL